MITKKILEKKEQDDPRPNPWTDEEERGQGNERN